jgi:multidrug efflux pump subunit AcrB
MTSSWPEEPGYHWVTHNDNTVNHLAKAVQALGEEVPDTATAQVHATIAQAEATLVVVHTLRDIMGRLYEQSVAVDNLRRTIAGFEGGNDDELAGDPMAFVHRADVSPED